MAEISIGAALGSGVGLIRRKPLVVLAWGAVRAVFSAATIGLFAPLYLTMFGQIARGARPGVATTPDVAHLMPNMIMMQGLGYLVQIGGIFVASVIYCAAFRAILHPDQGRWAYLRLGTAEFFVAVLSFVVGIAVFIGCLVLAIPVIIVVAILGALHLMAVAAIVGVLAGVVGIVGLIYVAIRFSMAGVMIVEDGKFHLFDSWAVTRGRAGGLFLMALALIAILLVAEAGLLVVGGGVAFAALGLAAGGYSALPAFFERPPMAILAGLAPLLGLYALAIIPVGGCAVAFIAAPWARVYRDIAHSDLSETFA